MTDNQPMLQPLLSHLFGPTLGTAVAEMAKAAQGERVALLGTAATVPGDLHQQIDDALDTFADDLHDPFPVIQFVDWQPRVGMVGLTPPWDLLIGVPPQGIKGEAELGEFLRFVTSTSSDRARAVFLFSETWLAREYAGRGRAQLMDLGTVRGLTFTGARHVDPRRYFSSPGVVLVDWVPTATRIGSAQVGRLAGPGQDPLQFQATLSPDRPWTPEQLDPQRAARIQRWAEAGAAQPLTQFADLPMPARLDGDDVRLLHGNQIRRTGLALDEELPDGERPERDRPDPRVVRLEPGDIVGRSFGEPLWVVVSEEHLGEALAATDHVLVVRPTSLEPYALAAFLRSDAAAMQLPAWSPTTKTRLQRRHLRELLVPDLELSGLRRDDPIAEFRAIAAELADNAETRYRSAFDSPTNDNVRASLAEAHADAAMAADLIRRLGDPVHRGQQFLPHPLARTLRVYQTHQMAGSPMDMHRDLLRFGETTIVMLGAIGLAYLDSQGASAPDEWTTAFTRGGVPLGAWLASANTGAQAARTCGESLGGLARALSTKSALNETLDFFLQKRNDDAHGAGPRSPYEYQQEVSELEESLYDLLRELSPLAKSDWFIVEGLDWNQRRNTFTVRGRSLRGDHPDFAVWAAERVQPLSSGTIHVALGPTMLQLGGLCTLRPCAKCLHEELYYPDRLRGSVVRLRSLDRGHEAEATLDTLGLAVPPSSTTSS